MMHGKKTIEESEGAQRTKNSLLAMAEKVIAALSKKGIRKKGDEQEEVAPLKKWKDLRRLRTQGSHHEV